MLHGCRGRPKKRCIYIYSSEFEGSCAGTRQSPARDWRISFRAGIRCPTCTAGHAHAAWHRCFGRSHHGQKLLRCWTCTPSYVRRTWWSAPGPAVWMQPVSVLVWVEFRKASSAFRPSLVPSLCEGTFSCLGCALRTAPTPQAHRLSCWALF